MIYGLIACVIGIILLTIYEPSDIRCEIKPIHIGTKTNYRKLYAVFIDNKYEMHIEERNRYEDLYYIYVSESLDNCKKYIEYHKDKFTNYCGYYKYIDKWCSDNKVPKLGSSVKYRDWFNETIKNGDRMEKCTEECEYIARHRPTKVGDECAAYEAKTEEPYISVRNEGKMEVYHNEHWESCTSNPNPYIADFIGLSDEQCEIVSKLN